METKEYFEKVMQGMKIILNRWYEWIERYKNLSAYHYELRKKYEEKPNLENGLSDFGGQSLKSVAF